MNQVLRKFFIMFFYAFCVLGIQVSMAQKYDGSVGNNAIPNSYEGFDQSTHPNSIEISQGANGIGGDPCEFQNPDNPICPIDDYMYVLVAVGIGYGFIKFRKQRGIVA